MSQNLIRNRVVSKMQAGQLLSGRQQTGLMRSAQDAISAQDLEAAGAAAEGALAGADGVAGAPALVFSVLEPLDAGDAGAESLEPPESPVPLALLAGGFAEEYRSLYQPPPLN